MDLVTALQQMESWLRNEERGVYVARLNRPSLSVGVGHSLTDALVRRIGKRGIPLVRRSTGGTAVLHVPGDLVWAIVLPRTDPNVGRDFIHAYGRLGAGVTQFLHSQGVEGSWKAPLGISNELCLLGSRGAAFQVDSRVLGGAAQHLSQTMLLHHGILPAQVETELIQELFHLPLETIGRHLVGLRELGIDPFDPTTIPALAQSLVESIRTP